MLQSRRGPTGPIAWPSLLMGNCNDHDLSLTDSIKDIERKPLKSELACAVIGKREGVWSFRILDVALATVCANAKALSGLRS
jgi:hypothetical protein